MGGRCFKKIILLITGCFLLLAIASVQARCLLADKYKKEGNEELENLALVSCAMHYNDDESQLKIAEAYLKGTQGFEKNELDALYMYQLAAETGNAEAQVKLAELLQSFDTSPERRRMLKEYQGKLKKESSIEGGFSGEILHPYTLLLLASERVENKWYYPSPNKAAPARASVLLNGYQISPEKKVAATKDASRWKTRKLMETAKEVFPEEEYLNFSKRLKDNTMRVEAMDEFKKKYTEYVDKKKKEREIPL